ncbi:unnamed protein product, partial [marine sediment metagenome]
SEAAMARQETTLVSIGSDGIQADADSWVPAPSADGRFVGFRSSATNLVQGDTNDAGDAFVHDRITGETTCVSVASDGTQANSHNGAPTLSADGRFVSFSSLATNLVDADTNEAEDVFVHDRTTGETTRVSVDSDGIQARWGAWYPTLSADGRVVAFESWTYDLVNLDRDIFVHDRATGETSRVSVDSNGRPVKGGSDYLSSLSADGRFVAFPHDSPGLVEDDTNEVIDVFVHDRDADEDGIFDEQGEWGAIST